MNYADIAKESRLKVLDLVYKAQTSHIGSLMGCADIFAVLFSKIDLDKDKFVLSAGWKAAMLYFHLWKLGRITQEELDSYCLDGSKWIGLAEPIHKDIIFAGGSMGMGLSAAVALAWSKKQRGQDGQVYVLESDGGMNCGINWEALHFAKREKLNNLTLIIENNGFQAMGKTEDIFPMNLVDTLYSIGWSVMRINGHNYDDIEYFFFMGKPDRPHVIVAGTTKGKGVSFMEDNNLWHYAQIKEDDYQKAKAELCQK